MMSVAVILDIVTRLCVMYRLLIFVPCLINMKILYLMI